MMLVRKIKTFLLLIKKDKKALRNSISSNISKSRISHIIPDKMMLKIQYYLAFNKRLNLREPQTFNEKLQWLKLYNRKDIYSGMVDKFEVREYIARVIGKEFLIPILGVWDDYDSIDFEILPEQFVLKCTHDSGSVVICKDKNKFDFIKAKEKLEKGLNNNLYWHGREWPYKRVKPRIVAELYLHDTITDDLRDYKFFCFNGKVKCYKIDFDRFIGHRANYYSIDSTLLPFGEEVCPPDYSRKINPPLNLTEMISLAEKLSKDIPFLRVDFYEVNNRVYFGELTFFPASGFGPFTEEKWDYELGDWIELPKKYDSFLYTLNRSRN